MSVDYQVLWGDQVFYELIWTIIKIFARHLLIEVLCRYVDVYDLTRRLEHSYVLSAQYFKRFGFS